MRPYAFIVTLFIMSVACVLIAIGDRSWGWLLGGASFFALGMYARRQRVIEQKPGYSPGLGVGRFVFVLLILIGGIYGIYWLSTAN